MTEGRRRIWADVMGGTWLALSVPPDSDTSIIPSTQAEVSRLGGHYDGFETVPSRGDAPTAHGPTEP